MNPWSLRQLVEVGPQKAFLTHSQKMPVFLSRVYTLVYTLRTGQTVAGIHCRDPEGNGGAWDWCPHPPI